MPSALMGATRVAMAQQANRPPGCLMPHRGCCLQNEEDFARYLVRIGFGPGRLAPSRQKAGRCIGIQSGAAANLPRACLGRKDLQRGSFRGCWRRETKTPRERSLLRRPQSSAAPDTMWQFTCRLRRELLRSVVFARTGAIQLPLRGQEGGGMGVIILSPSPAQSHGKDIISSAARIRFSTTGVWPAT